LMLESLACSEYLITSYSNETFINCIIF
jgi:hypothetical protein